MKQYGDELARELAQAIHDPVSALTDIDAIPPEDRGDGMSVNCSALSDPSGWLYVGTSTSAAGANVRVPSGAPAAGRWHRSGSGVALFQVDEWTNPIAAAPAGLKAASATTVSVQTVLAAALLAGGVAAILAYARNVTFTTAGGTPADAPLTATITGTDIDGAALSETVNLAQTATIAQGNKCFKTITSIVFAAADGTGATIAIGFGQKFGLSKSVKIRAGAVSVNYEIVAGVRVTTGTFADPTTSAPHGSYSPATAPDGANDYAVAYETV